MSPRIPATAASPARGPDQFVLTCCHWLSRCKKPTESRQRLLDIVYQRLAGQADPARVSCEPGDTPFDSLVDLLQLSNLRASAQFSADESDPRPSVITPAVLGAIYEGSLRDRRQRGIYYTPPSVVRFMCRQAIAAVMKYSPGEALQRSGELRILDPACGCGEFLVGMHIELENLLAQTPIGKTGTSASRRPRIRLIGVDLDQEAAAIARRRLALRKFVATQALGTPPPIETDCLTGDSLVLGHRMPFDVVIANPPYGVKADRAVRDRLFPPGSGSQSRDLYGLFIARGLELLRRGGALCFLVSDTWRTIRSHFPLRKSLLKTTTVQSVVDLPAWLFNAAVNTTILTLTNRAPEKHHRLISADLRALPRQNWSALETALASAVRPGTDRFDTARARHRYRQTLPLQTGNLSVFTGSSRIFRCFADPRLIRLGTVARIAQGLATGDNAHYLRKRPGAQGSYRLVDEATVLSDGELHALTPEEKRFGIYPAAHGGRCFVPYDKGGASEASQGRLANYYVPTAYFIDWSEKSVARLRTHRSARQGEQIAARFQNADCYFVPGLTWSDVGHYSPTFRISGAGPFDVKGSRILPGGLDRHYLLGLLCSRPVRFFIKTFANHTVSTQVDDLREVPLPHPNPELAARIVRLVKRIIAEQQRDPKYPYFIREQPEIDRLVSALYGLTGDQVHEIQCWFVRRYPRLAAAQAALLPPS